MGKNSPSVALTPDVKPQRAKLPDWGALGPALCRWPCQSDNSRKSFPLVTEKTLQTGIMLRTKVPGTGEVLGSHSGATGKPLARSGKFYHKVPLCEHRQLGEVRKADGSPTAPHSDVRNAALLCFYKHESSLALTHFAETNISPLSQSRLSLLPQHLPSIL